MRNKTLMKVFGLAMAASLAVIGCDNNGDDQTLANGPGTTTTGGSGSGTVGGGAATGSAGLTGTTTTTGGGGGGGGGGSGTTTGTSGTTTTGGSGTTGGTSGGGTAAVAFNNTLQAAPVISITSLNNPTQAVRLGNTIFLVDGFNLGNNGRLLASTISIVNGVPTFSTPVRVTARTPDSNISDTLVNPFGLATNGNGDLFISVGFGSFGNGAIIKVSNITAGTGTFTGTFENITDTLTGTGTATATTNPVNPAFLAVGTVDGSEYVYWSEYAQQNSSGGVRRIRTSPSATETADTIVNGLNFPAGIASDGTSLIIADSGGGQASIGQVVRVPLSYRAGDPPATPTASNIVGVVNGDQAISRPFDVIYDGSTGFFFTEGNAIASSGLGSLGQSAGTVRYLPRSSITGTSPGTARVVVDSVSSGAGIDVATLGGGNVGILYSESLNAPNGRIMRAVVNTNNPVAVTPGQIDLGLNLPLDVVITSASTPIFSAVVGYNAAQANGLLNVYGPTGP